MIYCQYAQNPHQDISVAAGKQGWNDKGLWILPSHKSGYDEHLQKLGLYIYEIWSSLRLQMPKLCST